MMTEIKRIIPIEAVLKRKSVLLLGPRRSGKSFFLQHQLPLDRIINLLEADTFRLLSARPEHLRELIQPHEKVVAIDEIQRLPNLMNEVHLLIETRQIRFVLTGSSARKLSRTYTSLMAGRAKRVIFHPLVSCEMKNFNLTEILTFGTLPPIFLSSDPWDDLRDYTSLYLREEIMNEALVRKIENFSRFLDFAALSNTQVLNFESIARDAQVPARTIREYFSLLEDTLIGTTLLPLKSTKERKCISKGKFYFFDLGVLNSMLKRKTVTPKTREYGELFEHCIYLELIAYREYFSPDSDIHFWRIDDECEVDFIINQEIAIEVKSTDYVQQKDFKGIKAFAARGKCRRKIVVSQDKDLRLVGDIEVIPYHFFLQMLWNKELF
jgi:uncharacterized protein